MVVPSCLKDDIMCDPGSEDNQPERFFFSDKKLHYVNPFKL